MINTMKQIIYIFAFALSSITGFCQVKNINTQKLDSLLTYLYGHNQFMGAVNITQHGKSVFNKAYGIMADANRNTVAADTNTLYRIGSISKVYTSVMILQLMEEKKLSLDDKLGKYFKDIPNASGITLRQMLLHQSGLHNYTDDSNWIITDTLVSESAWLKRIATEKPDFEPGAKTAYSNTNFLLLGYIIEKLTGKSYNQNLQERICKKAGLHSTYLPSANSDAKKKEAVSFMINDGQWKAAPETHVSAAAGAGGIMTTAAEANKFIYALFQNKLLQPATLNEMIQPAGEGKISQINSYGYGIMTIPFGTHKGYGHGGRIDNFTTSLEYIPEDDLCVAIFDNGVVYDPNDIAIGVLSIVYDMPYQFPGFDTAQLSEDQLDGLLGAYTSGAIALKITFTKKDGRLWSQAVGQQAFPLSAVDQNHFIYPDWGIDVQFTRDATGRAQSFLLKQSGGQFVFVRENDSLQKIPVVQISDKLLNEYEGIYSSDKLPIKISIAKNGNGLSAQASGQSDFPLEATSDTSFKFDTGGIVITFKKDSSGRVTGLTLEQAGGSYDFNKED